ncbi:MAG: aminoacyl-tRNA hydrolase [Planctomycetes bacterium]|nr:aminoacyl-tRNA hydrolase [Planctomycetota bacterium]
MANRIPVLPGMSLDEDELEFSFERSSGPGGQNVNKVSTAARLRFNVFASGSISQAVKSRLAGLAGTRMSADGILTILARRFRSQAQNRRDAIGRLVGMFREAAKPPKQRRPSRPTRSSKERRLRRKLLRSEKKQNRRTPGEV